MTRKIVSVNLDETVHEETKRLSKKKGVSLSRLTEELLSKFVREERAREQRQQQLKKDAEDKGQRLASEFMKKLLYDTDFRSEEWSRTGY